MDIRIRDHGDKTVSAEEVIDSSENVVRVGVKGVFSICWVEKPPDVM